MPGPTAGVVGEGVNEQRGFGRGAGEGGGCGRRRHMPGPLAAGSLTTATRPTLSGRTTETGGPRRGYKLIPRFGIRVLHRELSQRRCEHPAEGCRAGSSVVNAIESRSQLYTPLPPRSRHSRLRLAAPSGALGGRPRGRVTENKLSTEVGAYLECECSYSYRRAERGRRFTFGRVLILNNPPDGDERGVNECLLSV
jgi:hypothetical protein